MPTDDPLGPNADNPLSRSARRRREVFPSHDAAYENFSSKPPLNQLTPAALRAYVDHGFAAQPDGTVRLKCRAEHESDVYRMASAHGAFSRLGDVRCPVTLAGGTGADSPMTPEVLGVLAGRLPSARVEVFDGLGHFGPLEDPARVARAVLAAFEGS